MKISKFLYIIISILMLSGCGLSTMVSKYNTVQYTVTPPTLQTHGGKVALKLDANFPEKYFIKKATVDFTPVLVYPNGETSFKTITIQGEEASGGEKTIFYTTGGGFNYQDEVEYNSNMMNSKLELRAKAKLKSVNNTSSQSEVTVAKLKDAAGIQSKLEVQDLESRIIATGIIATPTRVLNNETPANDNHEYEHETILEQKATIYFLVNQSNIRTTEKSDDDINKLKEFVKNNYKTHSIEIISYASPEGSINTNDNVSNARMKSTLDYTKKLLRSLKVDGANNNDLYTETSVGEDWEGFESILKKSEIKDKRKINKIVNSVDDVELREQQIRDLAEIYDAIKDDVLPQLRKAVIVIRSFEPKKSDIEIKRLSTTNADSLNLNELLFSATLTDNKDIRMNIYTSVIELYNDWRGYNNLACIYLEEGNLTAAIENIQKAEKINKTTNSDILINKGIICAREGKLEKAQQLFNQGNASELNQAILDIRQGDYSKAARYFKNNNSHNATLAKIMNGENNVLCDENTAACDYLNAIAAARRGDNDASINNLNKAIIKNSSYKQEATIDLEFINLRSHPSFINLTK